jgi:hypothetical protein
MRDVKQKAPQDIDDVMKGRDRLKKEAYVRSKTEARYQHMLTIPFERSTGCKGSRQNSTEVLLAAELERM